MKTPRIPDSAIHAYPEGPMVSYDYAYTLASDLAAAREQLSDTKRTLRQFIDLAKAQGIQITMIECGDAAMKEKPHG